jgi:hypothetical protein
LLLNQGRVHSYLSGPLQIRHYRPVPSPLFPTIGQTERILCASLQTF